MSKKRPWRNQSKKQSNQNQQSNQVPSSELPPQEGSDPVLTESLEENLALLKNLFDQDQTFITRPVQGSSSSSISFYIAYCDGLVDSIIINEHIIKPLIEFNLPHLKGEDILTVLINQVLQVKGIQRTNQVSELIENVTYGDTVLLVEGMGEALLLDTKYFVLRSIEEPEGEKILSGPREGFTESLVQNLSMIRRRLRTNELKLKFVNFGRRTHTQACICYLEGIANKSVLAEFERRLGNLDLDGILDSNYITEMTKDDAFSPFRTTGYTERPDVVVGKILEGRIALLVDGTPVALTVPYLFIENFQSNEDYYLNYYYTSFSRMLRILGFFLTITVPGLYVAIVAYHHEMLPTPLLINIAMEQQSVPLPAALEAVIMLIIFEVLRETGIRMPSNIGQALSIVGALVIGQAAVEAKLVASPMIITVGLTGITSLLVPKMNAPVISVRFFLLFVASILGVYGFTLGLSALLIHLLSLRSYGIFQLTPEANFQFQELKDTVIRAPWWRMIKRPRDLSENKQRMTLEDEENGA